MSGPSLPGGAQIGAAMLPPKAIPYLTFTLLTCLFLIFLVELAFPIDPPTEPLSPGIRTLIALGGLQQILAIGQGQWWRMFTGPLLHAGPIHLVMNGLVLLLAGAVLERIVGHAWFGAIFVVAGLGGAAGSLLFNPHNLVTVGASGAIMGLFAAILVVSFRYTDKQLRGQLQRRAFQVLIPSLLPLASAAHLGKIDYAAHAVGAVTGGIATFFLSEFWPETESLPGFRWPAIAIILLGLTGALTGGAQIALNISSPQALISPAPSESLPPLIPPEYLPKQASDIHEASAWWYVAKYPADPRSHYYKALFLLRKPDLAEAEHELRTALDQKLLSDKNVGPTLKLDLQGTLAFVLFREQRLEEARQVAAPACLGLDPSSTIAANLKTRGLCPPPH